MWRQLCREMVERGKGRLVAISSLAAYRGLAKSAAYCASKAALSAYFESLRIDLRDTGVGVTIIHPGFIKTPLTAGRAAKMPYLMELDDAFRRSCRRSRRERRVMPFRGNSRRSCARHAYASGDVRLDCGAKFVSRISS